MRQSFQEPDQNQNGAASFLSFVISYVPSRTSGRPHLLCCLLLFCLAGALLVIDIYLSAAWYWGQAGVQGYAALVAGSIHDDAVLLHDRLTGNRVPSVIDVCLSVVWYWGRAGVPGFAALVAGSIHDDAVLLHDRLALHAFRSPLIVTFGARQPRGILV